MMKWFVVVLTMEQNKSCHQAFLQSTLNNALVTAVCIVCTRKLMKMEGDEYNVLDIPNVQSLLAPTNYHHAHKLWERMLIVEANLKIDEDTVRAWICDECHHFLLEQKKTTLLLANTMWISNVPHILDILMSLEQLLIACHFPQCYIFKLYPKNNDQTLPSEFLQHGMAGNVTLFEHNTKVLVNMLEGQLMPVACTTIASILAIIFVGTKKLPKKWLKSTF